MQKTIKIDVNSTTKLWPYEVVQVIEDVMQEGEVKHPDGDGWEVGSQYHISRAVKHLTIDKDIAHAFTRLMMAVAIERGYVEEGDE
ncbi:MAG: hypothetical protein U9Q82_03275 [Chloroflexota bacterium]|nr:hypothetical protein [Chloroflexota bacterium]